MKEIILASGVEIKRSIFDSNIMIMGERYGGMLHFDVPKDCDLIVLMGNIGGGYVPFRCLLPHQVYMDDIRKAFDEKHFEVIYVVPISSKAPFQIAYNGEYGQQRWENN